MLSNSGFESGTAGWVDWGNAGVATAQASTGSSALGVYSQLFDAQGHPVGSAMSVAAGGTFTGVAALAGGGYVIEYSQPGVVLVQVMDAAGAAAGAPVAVRTQAQVEAHLAGLREPALAGGAGVHALGDGGFAAQFRESHLVTVPGDSPISLMAQRYDALGNAVGAPTFRVALQTVLSVSYKEREFLFCSNSAPPS